MDGGGDINPAIDGSEDVEEVGSGAEKAEKSAWESAKREVGIIIVATEREVYGERRRRLSLSSLIWN